MTGSKYRELRKQSNKDAKILEKIKKYNTLKSRLRICLHDFNSTENLFDLVEAMRIGNKILEKEGFPLKEFAKYNFKKCQH